MLNKIITAFIIVQVIIMCVFPWFAMWRVSDIACELDDIRHEIKHLCKTIEGIVKDE